jgi:uncharacterized protein (DUF58 family)
MIFHRKTAVCREGWYYLLVLGFIITGSVLRDVNLLMVMAGMMFFPFLLNWRAVAAGTRGLRLTRRLPARLAAGDLLVVNVTVEKKRPRLRWRRAAGWGLVIDDAIENLSDDRSDATLRPRSTVWHVPAGERKRTSYGVRLNRRGRYRFGPFVVSSRFPLGLVRRTVVVDQVDTLTVLPRLGRLTPRWTRLYQETHAGSRSSRQKVGTLEGDFHSLRDWRPEDGRRLIHWRTTARRGTPVVRQFERQQEQDLALLVDLWLPERPRGEDKEAVERAVSFAATVVSDICHRGNSYLLLGTAGDEVALRSGTASVGLMHEQLDMLAEARADRADRADRLSELLAATLDTLRPGMSLVVVSPRELDVSDTEQFAALWEDPGRRAAAGRIVTIHAASDEIEQFCQFD